MKKIEKLAVQYNFEIVFNCTKCNTFWCTMEEWKVGKTCEICKTGEYITNYVMLDDVEKLIKYMEKIK